MLTVDQARQAVEAAERAYEHAQACERNGYGPPEWRYRNVDDTHNALDTARHALRKAEENARAFGRCGWCEAPAIRRTPVQTAGGVTVQVNICRTHG